MEYTSLGRTGLRVSVAGLGCGGPSRLGLRRGGDESEAVALVRRALDLGVNFIDTAESYGTEEVVGRALRGARRQSVVLSTKKTLPPPGRRNPEKEIRRGLEGSLRRLGTDYVDVYHLHGVEPDQLGYATERLVPIAQQLRSEGKIRFLGITEAFVPDPSHRMLARALEDDAFDVVMVGFNFVNQSARRVVLRRAREKNVGVLVMFAVRRALASPESLGRLLAELARKGWIERRFADGEELNALLLEAAKARSIPDAAYRYCRHEPGVHVVLTGTGRLEHLEANVESISGAPLPAFVLEKLAEIFARVDAVSGN